MLRSGEHEIEGERRPKTRCTHIWGAGGDVKVYETLDSLAEALQVLPLLKKAGSVAWHVAVKSLGQRKEASSVHSEPQQPVTE